MNLKIAQRGRMHLKENVTYQLRDKDGKLKPMFAVNKLGRAILEAARRNFSPYNQDGSLKAGLRAKLALNGLVIPGLTGSWVNEMQVSNGVPTAGKALVAGRINGSGSPAAATYIGVGVGTTAFAAGDTALETEKLVDGTTSATAHTSASVSLVTTDVTNDTAQLVATFAFTATLAITESGAFNASSTGTLLCRQTFSAINVVSGDSLQVTWKIDVD
jgi:hypothetical protein